ncbi:MAG: class I SAM-dependent methyltransferase, partial [Pyrinomonadaceae bacterium]
MERELYVQMRQVEDEHWWFVGRRKIVRHILSSLPLNGSARILDVGCGTGGNLRLLSEFGQVVGVEHDQNAASIARERNAAAVTEGSLPNAMPFASGQFDLIIALDVIEHIDDDVGSLATLNELLAPAGYLLLTVPAFPFLWSIHDEEHHHKRRYVAPTLRGVVERAGFELRHLTYYNTW